MYTVQWASALETFSFTSALKLNFSQKSNISQKSEGHFHTEKIKQNGKEIEGILMA